MSIPSEPLFPDIDGPNVVVEVEPAPEPPPEPIEGFEALPDAEQPAAEEALRPSRAAMDEAPAQAEQQAAEQQAGVWPSRIILGTMTTLIGMQQLAGLSIPFGGSAWQGSAMYPYQGDCFKEGSQHFIDVVALLKAAVPGSWHGDAADAYTKARSTLVTQAQTIADLDLEMEKLVKEHAEVVSKTQLGIGVEQDVLIPAYPIMCVLETNPQTFPKARAVAIGLSAAAVLAAVGLLSWCLGTSVQTRQAVGRLGYGDVIAAVRAVLNAHALAGVSVPQSSGSVASDRAQVSDTVSVSSAMSGTPASWPGSATGSGSQPSALTASPGEGQRFGVDAPPVAPTPEQVAPGTPTSPMPSAAQVRQPNPSGGVASPSNRPTPRGQQGASEEAVGAADREDTGAGSATAGAERAPIEVAAAGPEQAPAATPVP